VNKIKIFRVLEKVQETEKIVTLRFDGKIDAKAGQFVMVWVPGVGEKPFSLSYIPDVGITVADVGKVSNALCSISAGDKAGIRGPYGNGFELRGNKILGIGGGYGIAPLAALIEQNRDKEFSTICGANTKKGILFAERIRKSSNVIVTTCDGSAGIRGMVTDAMEGLLKDNHFDQIVTCGPEAMMAEVLKIAKKFKIPTQVSLDRYMKCGIGVCGSCAVNGLRVCKDGPVFRDHELPPEFGKSKRDKSGRGIEV